MEKAVLKKKFEDFMDAHDLNAIQTTYTKLIIDYIEEHGLFHKSALVQNPFRLVGSVLGIFGDNKPALDALITLLDEISSPDGGSQDHE